METLEIKVNGMVCSGCENRVQNALKTIDGVLEVTADYKNNLVTVKKNKDLEKNIIYERIGDLDFEVVKED